MRNLLPAVVCVLLVILLVFTFIFGLNTKFDYRYPVNEGEYLEVNFNDPTNLNEKYVGASFDIVSFNLERVNSTLTGVLGLSLDILRDILSIDDALKVSHRITFSSLYEWKTLVHDFSVDFEADMRSNIHPVLSTSTIVDAVFMVDLCRFELVESNDEFLYYRCLFCDDPKRLFVSKEATRLSFYEHRCSIPLDSLHDNLADLGISHEYEGVFYDYIVLVPRPSLGSSVR